MVKMLVVTPWFVPAWNAGGTALAAFNISKVCAELGVDVTVYTTKENGDNKLKLRESSYNPRIKIRYFNYFNTFKGSSWSLSMLIRILVDISKFDVVHIHGTRTAYESLIYALKAIGFYKGEIIITPHASIRTDWMNKIGRFIKMKNAYNKFIASFYQSSIIHYLSEEERADSVSFSPSSYILPNYIESLSKINTKPLSNCLVSVCRIHPQKNLIRAIKFIRENIGFNYHIIGPIDDKEYFNELCSLIDEYGIKDRVKFIGPVDNSELDTMLQSYKALVVSSDVEGVSMSVLEALSAGLPVLYSNGIGNINMLREMYPELEVTNWDRKFVALEVLNKNWLEYSYKSSLIFRNHYSKNVVKTGWRKLLEYEGILSADKRA